MSLSMSPTRWAMAAATVCLVAACGGKEPTPTPTPVRSGTATAASIDSMWARADDLFRRGKWDDAAVAYERVQLEMPAGDARIPLSRYRLAETRLGQKSNLQAVREFRRVSDDFATDTLAPIALVRAGDAYAALWRRPELDPTYGTVAQATYQEVLTRFPGTPAAAQASLKLSELEEKFAYKAYKGAAFYLRFKAYDSAVLLLKNVVATYPRTRIIPEALDDLIGAYRKLGYEEDVRDTCDYFRRFQPDSPRLAKSCPAATTPAPAPTTAPSGGTPGS